MPALEARAAVGAGIEADLQRLRRFHAGKRMLEMALFVLLWPCGAALTLSAPALFPNNRWLENGCLVLGIAASALALNAFVLLLHEAMHGVLLPSPWWNRWLGVLFGAPLLMSMSAYQVMHLRHHAYLGDPRDPDDYSNYSRRRSLVWTMHFARLAVGAFLYLALIPVLAWRHGSAVERRKIVQEYVVLGCIYIAAALLAPSEVVLLGWFVPVVLAAYMTNVRGFTQHGITDAADPFLASRTMTPNRLVALLLLNENYHLEHHLFPEVPNYHLAELHELIWPRLPRAVTGKSYVAFLCRFLRATLRRDDGPIGLVAPSELAERRCE